MKKLYTFLLAIISLSTFANKTIEESRFLEKTIIVKVASEYKSYCDQNGIYYPGIDAFLDGIQIDKIEKSFPNHTSPTELTNPQGIPYADLSTVYRLKYNSDIPLDKVIRGLKGFGIFEYVEPYFLHKMMFTPDDPSLASAWHLATIKAYDAWDVSTGDTNIVVGITDTGIDIDHPDLINNIKYNYADLIDATDNDGDGYTDNYRGWDLGENDNDPTHTAGGAHGTWVSGMTAATANNTTNAAGIGYDTKILPIKITNAAGQLSHGYEAIVYAADHGCDIINASWGSPNSWSAYGQDVINYATINKDALVVAAAGNDNDAGILYPASFDYVISVGGTDTVDQKWIFSGTNGSNYNQFIDLSGPSMVIYTTTDGGGFNKIGGGTSFASPLAAGVGALIKQQNPTYSALQIGEVLKVTSHIIDTIPFNAPYNDLLGFGRLDAHRAVTVTGLPGFMMATYEFTDNANDVFVAGDTIELKGVITNFLDPSWAATATLTCTSPNVTILNPVVNLGAVANLGTVDITSTPIQIKVEAGATVNEEAIFVLSYDDGSFHETQAFLVRLNPDWMDQDINNITMTVNDDGRLGYLAANQAGGNGFTTNNSKSYVYSMGFMVGNNSGNVSYSDSDEFGSLQDLDVPDPVVESDKDINGKSNDDPAAGNKLGVTVKHKNLGWNDAGLEDFIITEYKVINTSGGALDSVYVGLYADWDMINFSTNAALFDAPTNMGYAWEWTTTTGFTGTKNLTGSTNVGHYAFDNNGSAGSMNLYDGFSDAEMWAGLSNGNSRNLAGIGDISHMVSEGPYDIANGDSIVVAFALITGASLADLQAKGAKADSIYTTIRSITVDTVIADVTCKDSENGTVTLNTVYGVPPFTYSWDDPLGQTSNTAVGLDSGQYTCTITDVVYNTTQVVVNVDEPDAIALSFADTIHESTASACDGSATVAVSGGSGSMSYLWDDPGAQTTAQATGLCSGTWEVIVTDSLGCKDSISILIDVLTGIENLGIAGMTTTLFPNPANTKLNVSIQALENENVSIIVFDMLGKPVINMNSVAVKSGINNIPLNVANLASGVYVLSIQNDTNSVEYKLKISK